MDRRAFLSSTAIVGVAALAGCNRSDSPIPTPTGGPPTVSEPGRVAGIPQVSGTIATGLAVPWGLAFLPNGSALVTERDTGLLRHISIDGDIEDIATINDVAHDSSEGGLLGLAIHPDEPDLIYLYFTTATDNRVVRARFDGSLGRLAPLVTGIPRARTHNGGRITFGPDGHLYIATGDAEIREAAQDTSSQAGKILRVTADGEPADDNPFDNAVWSYGHRNVQGLAFDSADRLWASEFGQNDLDELNLIEAGGNYGWPEVEGPGGGFIDPEVTWAPSEASPAGIAIAHDFVLVTALRGRRLWVVPIEDGEAGSPVSYFEGDFGRLRTAAVAPDGSIWVTTSNRDGRGDPADDDDRIVRLTLD